MKKIKKDHSKYIYYVIGIGVLLLFLIILIGAIAMLLVTGRIGGNSAKHFMKMQISTMD